MNQTQPSETRELPPPETSRGFAAALSQGGCICVLLALITFAVFQQVRGFEFLNYDDSEYVTTNPHVQQGLTAKGLAWAFTSGFACNWHPLTWMSHMLDEALFGPGPAGPHVMNLLIHCANSALLFLLLQKLTGATWRSAMVAGLFAIHPLHIESVAWVSERKDVLSGLFFMLTLLAYMQYAKRKDSAQGGPVAMRDSPRVFYALALFCFALGLMSKPMLVTLPCVLLLLDLWPLQRVSLTSPRPQIGNRWPSIRPVLLEKLPFFALALGSSVVTFLVQKQGGAVDQFMPVSARLSNAVVSYARYLGKTIWPAHLAVPYPHPGHWPGWEVALALGLILALTLAVWVWRSRAFLLVGWLWFLGTLVPVIGLVQVGVQSLADRYTYLPLIGIFVMVVWGAGELFSRWNLPVWARTSVALLLLGALILRTENQLPCWRNSGTLFRHAIELTRNNHVAHGNLGLYLYEHGEAEQAIQQYEAALRIRPNDASNLNRLGSVWASRHDYQQAVKLYQAALRARPDFTDAHNNLGVVLKTMGKTEEARNEYEQALRIEPDNAEAHNNLANLLAGEGTSKEAIKHYRRAISIDPSLLQAWNNLGWTLASEGQFLEAISCYHQALRVKPQESVLHKHLADVLTASGRARAALPEYAEALRLAPNDVEAHVGLARAQAQLGNSEEALTQASEAARLDPANDEAKRLLEQLRQRSGTGAANTNGTHL